MQRFIILAILIFNCYGCATVPPVVPPAPPQAVPGIYHQVEKSQTLWRIAKIYDIDLDQLASINRLSDASRIEIGQMIFIPHRKKTINFIPATEGDDFLWPLRGKVTVVNKGVNIRPEGQADVIASRSGKVVFSSPNFKSFGKTVILEHADGFLTVYANNSQVLVKPGEYVRRSSVIAKVDPATNNYLHFQIRKGHQPQNPYFYLPR